VRITGGSLRGRTWPVQIGQGVRPTSSRVREALFNMVGQDLRGWSVLDAFGGSGLLGVEAASRGASPVLIVERNARTLERIGRAIAPLPLELDLLRSDVRRVLRQRRFDLVLLDPPYAEDPLIWLKLAAPATVGVLVIEAHSDRVLPDKVEGLLCDRIREYGDTQLGIFRRNSGDE
jgi:16S rRNA (guanine966-N2)-methyltransferase